MTQTRIRTATIMRCVACKRIAKQGMEWVTAKELPDGKLQQVLECECGARNWKLEELDVVLCKPNYLVVNVTPEVAAQMNAASGSTLFSV